MPEHEWDEPRDADLFLGLDDDDEPDDDSLG